MTQYEKLSLLRTRVEAGVAFVTIDNPPMNMINMAMIFEFVRLVELVEADNDIRVVVLQNNNPDYFIAHFDVTDLDNIPEMMEKPTELGNWHSLTEKIRTSKKVYIAKIKGRARGAGHELCLTMDMRFGAIGSTILGQPEIALGLLPGGSGTTRIGRIIGRGRALEFLLSGNDFDAEVAEKYGLLNRALPLEALDDFVDTLAYQIATFPVQSIEAIKGIFTFAEEHTYEETLLEEGYIFNKLGKTPEAGRRVKKSFAFGFQTPDGEMDITKTYADIANNETT